LRAPPARTGTQGHSLRSYSILDEEDDIIAAHRQQIEDRSALYLQPKTPYVVRSSPPNSMEMVQREMVLLQTVEQPGGSVET
jgi:hypothetical protein